MNQVLNGVAQVPSWGRTDTSPIPENEIAAEAAPAPLFRTQDVVIVMTTACGVVLSSVLGTLLFLR